MPSEIHVVIASSARGRKGVSRHVIDGDRRVAEVRQVPAVRRIETANSGWEVHGKSAVTAWKREQARGEPDVVSYSIVIMTALGMGKEVAPSLPERSFRMSRNRKSPGGW